MLSAGLRAPQGERLRGAPRPAGNGIGGAPRPDMGDGFYGASPHAPTEGKEICEAPPRAPTVRVCIYAGFHPALRSRTFLPKSPRDPKKPNRARYILSNTDSEQGCRRQPCFFVWKSISNFFVSLPNLSEKDVKGLLFRK